MQLDDIIGFVDDAVTTFGGVYDYLTTPLNSLDLTGVIPNLIIQYTPLGDATLLSLMLGSAVTVFITVTVVKWLLDIVL